MDRNTAADGRQALSLFASQGERLMQFTLGGDGVPSLTNELDLPSPIHYVWPHPSLRVLVVACSARWFTPRDDGHMLVVVDVPEAGPLRTRGNSIALRSRAIHVTMDNAAKHLLAVFNDPPGMQVHQITSDGSIGREIPQRPDLEVGTYAHQVRVSPDDRWVLVPARGNDPRPGRAEDPGSLTRFSFEGGRLEPVQVVAPQGGYGFGPRHLDFHPTLPVIYVSIERQNQLHVYRHRDGVIEGEPWQVLDILAPGKRPEYLQCGGAVHVHPQGTQVYVVNRDDIHPGSEDSHLTGDNTMAVFDLDPVTGRASPTPRHIELGAYHVRTFTVRPPWLVAASQFDVTLNEAQGPRRVPSSLGVFRLEADGGLTFAHREQMPSGQSMLFWCGFPAAYGNTSL